jgi:hypothetical protein
MNLPDDIAAWDSRDLTHINRVYADHADRPDFIPALIARCTSEAHQDGATWLFKHAIDEGDLVPEAIDPDLLVSFCDALPHLTRWPAQLHALQILAMIPIPRSCASSAGSFARSCTTSRKTFVRAWSYTVLFCATKHDPKEHAMTVKLLESTLNDDSAPASVKARIRNTLKSR